MISQMWFAWFGLSIQQLGLFYQLKNELLQHVELAFLYPEMNLTAFTNY